MKDYGLEGLCVGRRLGFYHYRLTEACFFLSLRLVSKELSCELLLRLKIIFFA